MGRAAVIVLVMLLVSRGLVAVVGSRFVGLGYQYQGQALAAELAAGEQSFEASLSTQLQQTGPDAPVVAPSPAPAAPCASPCRYAGSADFVITGQPTASLSGGQPGGAGNDMAYNLQRNALIRQNSLSVRITAHVWPASGGPSASRCELMTYRIMAQQPYYDSPSRSDCAANVGIALERDDRGCDPSEVATCDPTGTTELSPTKTADSAIVQCADGGSGACQGAQPRSADQYVNNQWQNGNQSAGWASH